ncbi:MAG: ABC transporter ATP-binding protein, partial [Clostridia bacterium]|nr:ABC transporter ATP-binding protein [Clostridia bacterium]
FKMLLNYFIQYWGHIVGVKMQADMRRDIFSHLQKMPCTYFDNNKTGTIMSRITNDLFEVSELAHHGPEDLFLSVVLFICSFILMVRIHLYLTLIVFIFIPVMIAFSAKKRLKMSAAFTKTRVELGEINANLENSISGIRVSKAYTSQKSEDANFNEGNKRLVSARAAAYKTMAEFHSGNQFFTDAINVCVLLAGGIFLYLRQINYGDFTAFLLFINIFMNPVKRMIGFIEQLQDGMSGFERFVEIMDMPEEEDLPEAHDVQSVMGDIEFDNVSFSYESNEVLKDVSFKVEAGKTLALVGPSGAGKTTICNLIPRFYEISNGKISVDGENIMNIRRESLRSHIGIVAQDVFLFNTTVYDNIAYGKPDADRNEVIEAAKKAKIDDFIESLPNGYDTIVGERGVKLSGGQKQRISIARMFLKDPSILILDEATSALDNTTEADIQKSLEELCSGRTTIVVAHRLSTIRNADKILVINDKGICEEGSHNELMAKDGEYARLYNAQFKLVS